MAMSNPNLNPYPPGYPPGYSQSEPPKHDFKVGDVVYLKSGSCAMTVVSVGPSNIVRLVYQNFETKAILETNQPIEVLRKKN